MVTQAGHAVVRGVRLAVGEGLSDPTDLVVRDGRVVAVTTSAPGMSDARVVDGGGRVALPGLVDAHTHGAAAVFDRDVQLAMLRQGVTSVVVGQDGVGFAPSDARTYAWAARYFAAIDGEHPSFTGGSVADLLGTFEGTVPVNVATLVPHGTLRYLVMGPAQRAATEGERVRMAGLLSRALDDGAVGLSTGLEYVPAAWADEAELVALARVVARRGLPHVSHMRGYEHAASGAFAELMRVARATGVATHVAHLHGPLEPITADLAAAAAEGLDVSFDSYPYLRGFSLLSMVGLPRWLPLADPDACLRALADGDVLERLHDEHLVALGDLWPRITLAGAADGGRARPGLGGGAEPAGGVTPMGDGPRAGGRAVAGRDRAEGFVRVRPAAHQLTRVRPRAARPRRARLGLGRDLHPARTRRAPAPARVGRVRATPGRTRAGPRHRPR